MRATDRATQNAILMGFLTLVSNSPKLTYGDAEAGKALSDSEQALFKAGINTLLTLSAEANDRILAKQTATGKAIDIDDKGNASLKVLVEVLKGGKEQLDQSCFPPGFKFTAAAGNLQDQPVEDRIKDLAATTDTQKLLTDGLFATLSDLYQLLMAVGKGDLIAQAGVRRGPAKDIHEFDLPTEGTEEGTLFTRVFANLERGAVNDETLTLLEQLADQATQKHTSFTNMLTDHMSSALVTKALLANPSAATQLLSIVPDDDQPTHQAIRSALANFPVENLALYQSIVSKLLPKNTLRGATELNHELSALNENTDKNSVIQRAIKMLSEEKQAIAQKNLALIETAFPHVDVTPVDGLTMDMLESITEGDTYRIGYVIELVAQAVAAEEAKEEGSEEEKEAPNAARDEDRLEKLRALQNALEPMLFALLTEGQVDAFATVLEENVARLTASIASRDIDPNMRVHELEKTSDKLLVHKCETLKQAAQAARGGDMAGAKKILERHKNTLFTARDKSTLAIIAAMAAVGLVLGAIFPMALPAIFKGLMTAAQIGQASTTVATISTYAASSMFTSTLFTTAVTAVEAGRTRGFKSRSERAISKAAKTDAGEALSLSSVLRATPLPKKVS